MSMEGKGEAKAVPSYTKRKLPSYTKRKLSPWSTNCPTPIPDNIYCHENDMLTDKRPKKEEPSGGQVEGQVEGQIFCLQMSHDPTRICTAHLSSLFDPSIASSSSLSSLASSATAIPTSSTRPVSNFAPMVHHCTKLEVYWSRSFQFASPVTVLACMRLARSPSSTSSSSSSSSSSAGSSTSSGSGILREIEVSTKPEEVETFMLTESAAECEALATIPGLGKFFNVFAISF